MNNNSDASAARRRPADHAMRRRALQADKSFIVQAPAGSGKTELLVRRYLSLLAVVTAPEEILAITFTKKATAEMRERIINALRLCGQSDGAADGSSPGSSPDSFSDQEFRAIAAAARANDQQHGWRIIENTRRLRIQTIDAFCGELVRRMPWSARFGSPPAIIDDPAPLYLRAAKRSLDHIERNDHWSGACQQLLALVDADWNKTCALLAGMLGQRDKWMRLLGAASGAGLRERLEGMWQQLVEAELQRAAAIPPSQQAELAALGAFAAGNLLAAGKASTITALQGMANFPEADCRRMAHWHGIAALVLTQTGGLRKTVSVNQGFPSDKKAEKARMRNLLQQLRAQPAVVEVLGVVSLLPGARFSDRQWHSIDALMRLLPLAAAELRLLFTEQNQADYIELTQRASMALFDAGGLGEAGNPTDLALAFDHTLSHLLVDEFQDTSSAHIELITQLTAGWQRDDGRTVFFVGDPMQSIYRFREAEVANFLQVQQFGLGDIRPEAITLESNFRSAPALVDWFNRTFREVLPGRDDIANSAVSYAAARAHLVDDGADEGGVSGVFMHPGVGRSHAQEAACIAARIGELVEGCGARQSIAVLGRSRRHLHPVAEALRRRGVAFQAMDLEKLDGRPAIRDLLAITRALAQPADRIACLSLLRAPWCGMRLADIAALAEVEHAAASPPTLPELWRDPARVATLSADGQARLRRLLACLETAMRQRGRIGLRQGVEAAWLALGGPATINASDLDDCRRYLDVLDQLEAERLQAGQIEINAASLKTAVETLWARPGADAQVQLLSIHKAKGLEFDVVFLPGLGRPTGAAEKTLLRWRKLPQQLLLAPLPSSADKDDAFYGYLAHLDKAQARYETGRLLYVACTRARRALHLFGGVNAKEGAPLKPPAASLLRLLWPLMETDFIQAAQASGEAAPESPRPRQDSPPSAFKPQPLQRLPLNWRPPALPESIHVAPAARGATDDLEFSWAGESARIVGIVIHQILQRVDDIGWARWRQQGVDEKQLARWRSTLMGNGIAAEQLEAALAQVADAIGKTQSDPKAAWIFSRENRNSRDIKTEWSLAGLKDGKIVRIIIDRSFIDEHGARWIIDFKSSRHQGADVDAFLDQERRRHQLKMSLYATIISQLEGTTTNFGTPTPKELKLGLYFPALQGWREWSE